MNVVSKQTKTTLLDEIFAEPSDGCCFKQDQINSKFSLKEPNKLDLGNFHNSFRLMLSQTEPNKTLPSCHNHINLFQNKTKLDNRNP